MPQIWAGIDAGKIEHHCVVIDERARHLLSRRVPNDEPDLLRLLADVRALARRRVNVLWALLRDGRRYNPAPPLALAA